MNETRLWPSAFAALLASLCWALATRPNLADWQRLFLSTAGVLLGLYATLNAVGWLSQFLPTWAEFLNRLRHPEIDIAGAVRGLNELQLAYALGASGRLERRAWSGGIETVFVQGGRELSADWFANYLDLCIGYGTEDLPSLRRHANGSAAQLDEQAAIHWLIAAGYVEPRPGQRFTWLPGTDAETTRKRLFGDD